MGKIKEKDGTFPLLRGGELTARRKDGIKSEQVKGIVNSKKTVPISDKRDPHHITLVRVASLSEVE